MTDLTRDSQRGDMVTWTDSNGRQHEGEFVGWRNGLAEVATVGGLMLVVL
jgi:hypothetical protein